MALTEKYVNDAGSGSGDGSSAANAMSYANFVTAMGATAAAGERYNIAGPITSRTTTTDTFSRSGSATSPIIIRGCSSLNTIGDGYLGRTNSNGPLITTNMPTITYTTGRLNSTGTFIIYESIQITGAPSAAVITLGADSAMRGCNVTNSGTNAASAGINASGARDVVFDCDAQLTGGSGGNYAIQATANSVRVIANRVKGGPAVGITTGNAANTIAKNTIFASTGIGIAMTSTTGTPCLLDNTIVGGGADGINIVTGATVLQFLSGNMVTDNTGDGLDMVSTANAAFLAALRTRDNASGIANGGDWITATSYGNVTTDTGGPETDYVNFAGNDFNLIATSPATSASQPQFASMGALQRSQTGGGGMTRSRTV